MTGWLYATGHRLLAPVTPATNPLPPETAGLLATTLAPTGAIATMLGLIFAIVTGVRKVRTDGYADAMKRAAAAEARETETRTQFTTRLEGVETELRNLRDEQGRRDGEHAQRLRDQDDRHRRERQEDRQRLLVQTAVNYRLAELLAQHGIDLPDELDPAKPNVPLQVEHHVNIDD